MKKLTIVIILLILSKFSQAQWYYNDYQVKDINQLTLQQLNESLKTSKDMVLGSGLCAIFGGCMFLAGINSLVTLDNPTMLEQLIGEKGMNDICAGVGAAMVVGGTIGFFGYLERVGHIKTAIRQNFPISGSLHLAPRVIYNNFTASYRMGISLTYNF